MEDISLWNKWHGCQCVKQILLENGYDSSCSLKLLDDSNLDDLENCVEKDWQTILSSIEKCSHFEIYSKQQKSGQKFKFLLGHRALLLNWCKELNKPANEETIHDEHIDESKLEKLSFSIKHPAFSPIMKELIISALINYKKSANNHRFADLLRDFAIYIYIMAGKAAYEIIAANIPLHKSISKLNRLVILFSPNSVKKCSRYFPILNKTHQIFLRIFYFDFYVTEKKYSSKISWSYEIL